MSTEPNTIQVLGDSSAIDNNNYSYKCHSALLIELDQNGRETKNFYRAIIIVWLFQGRNYLNILNFFNIK